MLQRLKHVVTLCVCVFQFAVLMWLLTYVGALFNGLTLLILGEVIPIQARLHFTYNITSKHCC